MNKQYTDIFGYEHICLEKISSGGQGAVFRTQTPNLVVKLGMRNGELIRDEDANRRYNDIRLLPIPQGLHITLPLATLEGVSGYVMTLLDDMSSFERIFSGEAPEGYSNPWLADMERKNTAPEMLDWFRQYLASGGRRRRLEAFFKCACALARLHGAGLVYCDISGNNLFMSTRADFSEVWMIDADNLDWGRECAARPGFQTPGYGAPEIMSGKGNSRFSDCYSFAVALFWILCGKHPFDGAGVYDEDGDFQEGLRDSGTLPWIFDEDDDSNEGDLNGLPMEWFVSRPMESLLRQTFSQEGRDHPGRRPTMAEWVWTLGREVDLTVRCPRCGMDYHGVEFDKCPWCDTKAPRVGLRSFLQKNSGEPFWRCVHELPDDACFRVPLRILRGVRTEEADEFIFRLERLPGETGSIKISGLHSDWRFFLEGFGKELYGSSVIPGDCRLRCENGETVIWIEVNIFEAT